ncbi:sporulation protein [Virgibacillus sp. MSP4-1]|uniref:hypothetical protein n=1 Tax=Virgibacillus sp. MSP4-1 TaxID=2700081 RepID=UPI0003A0E2B3|nr:hypothetical protein [Virgibacillus sp. MSP4-1]QHS22448.1 sporulation protein [Virgibacillus sp. MSP4-1]
MDQSLSYLQEVLSNYTEDIDAVRDIDHKIAANHYSSENLFSRDLDEEESRLLREILLKEIHHANESGDHERGYQLHEVYELLY